MLLGLLRTPFTACIRRLYNRLRTRRALGLTIRFDGIWLGGRIVLVIGLRRTICKIISFRLSNTNSVKSDHCVVIIGKYIRN